MNNLDTHSRMSKVYTILRLVTTIFSIFCPIAMICSAIVITLREGDWWLNLFAAYLAGILMIFGTIYLSLLTLMKEATRYIGNKKRDFSDTPITKWIHRLLIGLHSLLLIKHLKNAHLTGNLHVRPPCLLSTR